MHAEATECEIPDLDTIEETEVCDVKKEEATREIVGIMK